MAKKRKKSTNFKKSLTKNTVARIFSHWLTFAILGIAVAGFITYGTSWAYAKTYEGRIYPGIKIGTVEIGGMTPEQAKEKLTNFIQEFLDSGFEISYQETKYALPSTLTDPVNTELSRELFIFEIDKTIEQALGIGRDESWWDNVQELSRAKTLGLTMPAVVHVDEEALQENLQQHFARYDSPAKDAKIIISFPDSGEPAFSVTPEQAGQELNYEDALAEIEKQLLFLEKLPIALEMADDKPTILASDANAEIQVVKNVLNAAPATIIYSTEFEKFTWEISKQEFAAWLTLEKDSNNDVTVSLLQDKIVQDLAYIADKIEIEPQNAKFKMENGKVVEFQGSRDGITVDWDASVKNFKEKFITNTENQAEIEVMTKAPDVPLGDLNDLGIKELVGVGRSNFKGSPTNRRHNIRVGSEKLDGLLIKPGEEFSTITALAPVDAANGYLPELVIKENKTIPEYGGGLCQIGTTMFRVALSAGLPITERHPHSYRVVYYEPAGKDAAVYEMHPDVRFINDTGNYILIQTHIDGDELIFEFWGTYDSRDVYQSDSRIYNITSPPPLKEVETLDLAPGERKCTEGAHAGADADFDYRVTYPNGEVKETTFHSHYRAWGAVCLIGVEELTEPTEEEAGDGEEQPLEIPLEE